MELSLVNIIELVITISMLLYVAIFLFDIIKFKKKKNEIISSQFNTLIWILITLPPMVIVVVEELQHDIDKKILNIWFISSILYVAITSLIKLIIDYKSWKKGS